MRSKFFLLLPGVLFSCLLNSQVDFGGLLNEAKRKAQEKAKEKVTEGFEKQRKEFDESNFNYAILFLDNSGTFEADEKGNAFSNTLLNASKAIKKEEKSTEERAYTSLRNGELLMAGNRLTAAEQSFRLAKFLYESDGKAGTDNYAQTLNNLGLLSILRGRFSEASRFNDAALRLRETLNNAGMLVVSKNNSAVIKKETGMLVEAEKEFLSALQLNNQKDILASALINNNLALTYLEMNKLKEAEKSMLLSVSEASKAIKEQDANYIKLQINLANIYRINKKFNEAEKIFLKAITIKEKKLGQHPDLAHLKRGLAQLYYQMGRAGETENLLIAALEINCRKLGDENPATLAVMQELGTFYREKGDVQKATELITSTAEKKKKVFGEDHGAYVHAVEELALLNWQINKKPDATAQLKEVLTKTMKYINTYFSSLNESEKAAYWEKTNRVLNKYYAFAVSSPGDPQLQADFYTHLINAKGFLMNNSASVRAGIMNGNDEQLKDIYRRWLETRENLNYAFQLSKEELAKEKINSDSLQRRSDELERELSKRSEAFRQSSTIREVTSDQVRAALGPGEAAIEIVQVSDFDRVFTGESHYYAVVVTNAGQKLVAIGNGEKVASAINDFRTKVTSLKPENGTYQAVWAAVDKELKGISHVFLSADGVYHLTSIYALRDAAGKYLADKYRITGTGTTKDILSIKASGSGKPASAFLLGNPAYGGQGIIEQLPGTEAEIKQIQKMMTASNVKTEMVNGKSASESKFRSVKNSGILHVATHGFFLADPDNFEVTKVLGVDVAAIRENPLLRSGLLFSDCENVFNEEFHPSLAGDNGVLTAYEAMSMQLEKTDLVVLSACETGLGKVQQGEGVYGLQRSFMVAGARSVIMSLWSVSDEATAQLMIAFYTNYLKSGNKSQAFHDAIKQLKLKYKEPFYWGAFVMVSR